MFKEHNVAIDGQTLPSAVVTVIRSSLITTLENVRSDKDYFGDDRFGEELRDVFMDNLSKAVNLLCSD